MTNQQATYNEELYLIKNRTTVALSEKWDTITDADRQLLQKILQAVRLSTASVRIVHQAAPGPNVQIFFGADEVKTEGNCVLAPSLTRLQNDAAGKQKLWIALKALFGL